MFLFETVCACHYGPAIRKHGDSNTAGLGNCVPRNSFNINLKNEGIFCFLFDKESVAKYS